jgi:DNA-binding MarR family transcriptional regulator
MKRPFDIEESLGYLLAKNHQRAFGLFRAELERYDLTPPQFAVLAFLWKADGLTQARLGQMLTMDRTTISGVLDRLERHGLVVRKEDPADRRAYRIYLTERGRALEEELGNVSRRVNALISSHLEATERRELIRLLKKLLAPNER